MGDIETRVLRICQRFSIPYFADEFQADSDGPNGGGSYALKQAPSAHPFQLAGSPAKPAVASLGGGAATVTPGIVGGE